MSESRQKVSRQLTEHEKSPEPFESYQGPDLDVGSDGYGYMNFSEAENYEGIFSGAQTDIEYFDSVSDDNLLLSEEGSAKLLEHYFGQLSIGDGLDDFLDYIDSAALDSKELDEMSGSLLLELNLMGYEGRQHIRRHEGEVAFEVVEYLTEESSWADRTYFLEDEEMLFIRSSP